MSNSATHPDDSDNGLSDVSTHLKAIQTRLDNLPLNSDDTSSDQPLKLQPPFDPSDHNNNVLPYRSEKSTLITSQFQNILNQIGQAAMESTSKHLSRQNETDIGNVCFYLLIIFIIVIFFSPFTKRQKLTFFST